MSIVGAFPTTIKNGDLEDATVVMSLFAFIQSQVNAGAAVAGPLAASGITGAAGSSDVQAQTFVAFTTGGTATAYTLNPTPAITAYASGQSFFVNFNAVSGANPTLTFSGIATPPNLVKQAADGTYSNIAPGEITLNHRSRVTLISATQALVEKLPGGPSFSAYCSSIPSVASGTFTKVPFDTKEYDLTNAYSATLYRGTPAVAGLFHINGFVRIGGNGVTDSLVSIYKNGVEFKRCNEYAGSADTRTQNMPFSEYVQLTATDYIEIYIYIVGTSGLQIGGGQTFSNFQMTLIR